MKRCVEEAATEALGFYEKAEKPVWWDDEISARIQE